MRAVAHQHGGHRRVASLLPHGKPVGEELVGEMGIMDMDVSNNWCTRFIKQHDLSVGGQSAAARKPVAKWKPAQLAGGRPAGAVRRDDAMKTRARYEAQLRYEAAEALFKYEAAESRLRALAACRLGASTAL